jgi:molybdopterin synthase sulfurtransferase
VLSHRQLKLVSAQWLNQQFEQSEPLVIVECGWGAQPSFVESHIPNAIYLDTGEIEADTDVTPRNLWNLRPESQVLATLAKSGVTVDRGVVVYSREPLASARVCWLLLMAGAVEVCWLDGGWKSWADAGYSVEGGMSRFKPLALESQLFFRPEYRWTLSQLKFQIAEAPQSFRLIDIRALEEHLGQRSGYSYIQEAGRIPGSIWGGGGSCSNTLEDFLKCDNTLRPLSEIAIRWHTADIRGDKQTVFYCGTGWRASVAFLCAYLMGWTKIAVFDGGWLEWTYDKSQNKASD